MTVQRKPGAAVEAVGGSPAQTSAQRTLVSLLELAYGSAAPAHAAVDRALALAARQELPPTGPELVTFARAYLMAALSDDIGPRLTVALIDDLVAQLDPSSASPQESVPPASMPRPVARGTRSASSSQVRATPVSVLLVDADPIARTTLARAILRAQLQVTVVESVADLRAALRAGEAVDVAVIDAQHPAAHSIVEELVHARPASAVLVRSGDPERTRAVYGLVGVRRFDVHARDVSPDDVVAAIRHAADEP
jgi:CheY-like chemotaxis protein